MEEINRDFKGIELATIEPGDSTDENTGRFRKIIANIILGDRQGMTIIGPASIVKEIKKDPSKIELLTSDPAAINSKKKKK